MRIFKPSTIQALAAGLMLASSAVSGQQISEDEIRPVWESLNTAVRHFAAQTREIGKTQALRNHFAENAVVFHRGPTDAHELYQFELEAEDTAQLVAHTHYNDVAVAGDLGLTAGPYQHISDISKGANRTQGHLIAVWRRFDDEWRIVADVVVSIPGILSVDVEPHFEDTRAVLAETASTAMTANNTMAELVEADERFAANINFRGGRRAMLRFGLDNQRVYLPGMAPGIGIDAGGAVYGAFLDDRLAMDTISITSMGGYLSESGEAGYTYGTMHADNDRFKTSYLRFWRYSPVGEWKIAVEVLNPF